MLILMLVLSLRCKFGGTASPTHRFMFISKCVFLQCDQLKVPPVHVSFHGAMLLPAD